MKVTNGKVCSIKDVGSLEHFVNNVGYKREDLRFKNGNRTVISDSNGNWKMTILKYDENDINYVVL